MEKNKILDHCLPKSVDIASIHKDRKKKQEPEACAWVHSEESIQTWLQPRVSSNSNTRLICVHGIPGAGKTVLSSFIIEAAAASCKSHGYAYYYCLYSRDQDETVSFLKHVLRQLCKQAGTIILPMFKDAYNRGDALFQEDLLECIAQISQTFKDGVHIVIDAVDESKPRKTLIETLGQLGTTEQFWNVSLLFTSREENEIMETIRLLGNACACISISNPNVREDIKRYIQKQLPTLPLLESWDNDFVLERIEKPLTRKAKGR